MPTSKKDSHKQHSGKSQSGRGLDDRAAGQNLSGAHQQSGTGARPAQPGQDRGAMGATHEEPRKGSHSSARKRDDSSSKSHR